MTRNILKTLRKMIITLFLSSLGLLWMAAFPEEGMFPLSEIHNLNLKRAGLKIPLNEVYNPNGVSLVDALVNVGGCSGSFVSSEGLIITNHHCAFGAVQLVSTPEHDYIHDGFVARTRGEELPAKGTTCRITESYQDVSNQVLSALKDTMSFTERTKAIERKIKEIVAAEETKNKEIRAEVSEMFIGKTYVLFRYRMIKDVRLVYVPPRSIGEFGGEEDNWIWPRHTGDFSFMRAYVGPDGRSADYSTSNVPYQPKKFLKVNPEGVNENDFVFILGYPGRTFRHQTSHFLEYQQKIQLPFIAEWFGWQIDEMTKMGKADHSVDIKLSARIKGLANVMKNYRGKLKGLARLPLVETKRNEEGQLQKFIEKDKQRNTVYGNVLNQIGSVYAEMMKEGKRSLILGQIYGSSTLLSMGRTVLKVAEETRKPDLDRETEFMDRNLLRLKQSIPLRYNSYHQPADKLFLKHILLDAVHLQNKRSKQ